MWRHRISTTTDRLSTKTSTTFCVFPLTPDLCAPTIPPEKGIGDRWSRSPRLKPFSQVSRFLVYGSFFAAPFTSRLVFLVKKNLDRKYRVRITPVAQRSLRASL